MTMADYSVYENGLDLTDEILDCILMSIQAIGIKSYLKNETEKRKLEEEKRLRRMSDGEKAEESLRAFYRRNKR
jgi:hypothetical protein